MNFKKFIYISFIITSLISLSIYAMQPDKAKAETVETDELWIDRLRKYDPIAANIIIHLVKLNPSLEFFLKYKQSEVEKYFKDHPEILDSLLKISQSQLQQQNITSNSPEKTK